MAQPLSPSIGDILECFFYLPCKAAPRGGDRVGLQDPLLCSRGLCVSTCTGGQPLGSTAPTTQDRPFCRPLGKTLLPHHIISCLHLASSPFQQPLSPSAHSLISLSLSPSSLEAKESWGGLSRNRVQRLNVAWSFLPRSRPLPSVGGTAVVGAGGGGRGRGQRRAAGGQGLADMGHEEGVAGQLQHIHAFLFAVGQAATDEGLGGKGDVALLDRHFV